MKRGENKLITEFTVSSEDQQIILNYKKEYEKKAAIKLVEEAQKQNPYNPGDILRDHFQLGRIIKPVYRYHIESMTISCVFLCERLTKNLQPYKSEETCTIHLSNIKEIIK